MYYLPPILTKQADIPTFSPSTNLPPCLKVVVPTFLTKHAYILTFSPFYKLTSANFKAMKTQNSFFTIPYEFSSHQKIYLFSPNGIKVDLILMITEDIGPPCIPTLPPPQDCTNHKYQCGLCHWPKCEPQNMETQHVNIVLRCMY